MFNARAGRESVATNATGKLTRVSSLEAANALLSLACACAMLASNVNQEEDDDEDEYNKNKDNETDNKIKRFRKE
jgi:hypothetical protein